MSTELRYWDANCFLGWLREEEDKVKGCGEVLERVEQGDIELYTSALTLAEVLHLKGSPKIPREDREKIKQIFKRPYIVMLTRIIAETSQELVWEHKIEPKDAVHVATALFAKADRMDTFDQKLLKMKDLEFLGFKELKIRKHQVVDPSLPGM